MTWNTAAKLLEAALALGVSRVRVSLRRGIELPWVPLHHRLGQEPYSLR